MTTEIAVCVARAHRGGDTGCCIPCRKHGSDSIHSPRLSTTVTGRRDRDPRAKGVTVLDLVDIILYVLEIFHNLLSRLRRRDVDLFVVVA